MDIIFRGKRKDNGQWVYGDLITNRFKGEHFYIKPTGNCFEVKNNCIAKCIALHEVDKNTIGKYVGLCDKNGNKIFEGDILMWIIDNRMFTVEWHDKFCSYNLWRSNCPCGFNFEDASEMIVVNRTKQQLLRFLRRF